MATEQTILITNNNDNCGMIELNSGCLLKHYPFCYMIDTKIVKTHVSQLMWYEIPY